jgi:hypothetical protein
LFIFPNFFLVFSSIFISSFLFSPFTFILNFLNSFFFPLSPFLPHSLPLFLLFLSYPFRSFFLPRFLFYSCSHRSLIFGFFLVCSLFFLSFLLSVDSFLFNFCLLSLF